MYRRLALIGKSNPAASGHRCAVNVLIGATLLVGVGAQAKSVEAPKPSLFSATPSKAEVSNIKVFEEPLVSVGEPTQKEIRALAEAIDVYVAKGRLENLEPMMAFVKAYPESPWRLTLLVNLGLMYRHTGQITKALEAWEAAWAFGRDLKDPKSIALSHRALGELLEANAGLGRPERLSSLVKESDGRPLVGLITEKLSFARESLAYMKMSPETAFRCGPVALAHLKATESPLAFADLKVEAMLSSDKGTTLAMNQAWASSIGLKLQAAKRTPGAGIPVPCMLHFSTGHFAAAMVVKADRVLVQDPFLGDTWIPLSVLDREASGYALIPAGELPKGWSTVLKAEAETVWGKGAWGPGRPDDTRPDSYRITSSVVPALAGMPNHTFHANLVSLNLDISASGYKTTNGPKVEFKVTYNQREYGQPQVFDYCNLGPKWTFTYLACLKDDTTNPDFNIALCNPGGGGLIFQSRGDGTFLPENYTQAQLIRQPGNTYVIQYLDGQKDYYEAADRAWGLRRVILTRRQDASGKEIKFTWDAMLRLVSITDADAQVTSLSYESPSDPLKLTKVTDPTGKTTRFEFNEKGNLIKTINAQGVATTFSYGPTPADPGMPADFIHSMTNPTGRVLFREGETLIGPSYRRWLEARNSDGRMERVEGGAGYAYEIDPEQLPKVPELDPNYHPLLVSFREAFYWSSNVYDFGKPNFRKARHIRWGHGPGGFSSGIAVSEKEPSGPRHWFVHAGDFWGGVFPTARTAQFPLTLDGTLKPAAQILGVKGTPETTRILAPVFSGNRRLVTRDYWVNPDGSLGKIQYDYDPRGRLIQDGKAL